MTKAEAKRIALGSLSVEVFFHGRFLEESGKELVPGLKFEFDGFYYEVVGVVTRLNLVRTRRRIMARSVLRDSE